MVILNQKDEMSGEFPLHAAVRQGLMELAKVMLDKGAKVNCSNTNGLTPLHYAVRKGDMDLLGLLMSKGAYMAQDSVLFWTPLHYAAYHGHEAVVERILSSDEGVRLVNETDSFSRTALHVACRQGNLGVATQLLKAGAQVKKDSTGHAPFYYLSIKDMGKEDPAFHLDPNYAEASSAVLCGDLRALYKSGELSDLVFVVEGQPEPNDEGVLPVDAPLTTQEYKAHRAIIHARAPALLRELPPFRTLTGTNQINLSGLTHSLFSSILEYIYSGGISFKETDLDFVFNLANKGVEYELPALSSFAESMILSNLTEENVIGILEAASQFKCAPRVENYCRYYILRFFDKISQTTPEEVDQLPASQFEAILSRLSINREPAPSTLHIDQPPPDIFQSKPRPGPASMPPPQLPLGDLVYQGSAYATPKAKPPKKPKSGKGDSPRGMGATPVRGTPPGGMPAPPHRTSPASLPSAVGSAIPSPPDSLYGRTIELVKRLQKDLMNERESSIFNSRVDYEAWNLIDYPYIIKHPMDLGTVNRNLNNKTYKNMSEWAQDVRRVWDNAKTYNAPESDVYAGAETLSNFFEQRYASIQRQLEIPHYDPYVPKPIEWYVSAYKRGFADYTAAHPQAAAAQAAGSLPVAALPPQPTPTKPTPAPKKAKAATASTPANNRKRKPDQRADEYDMAHAPAPAAPSAHYNGSSALPPMSQPPMPSQPTPSYGLPAQAPAALSADEQNRLQSRLEMLDEGQASEVISILQIQPNEAGEYEIAIENLPPATIRVLEDYLIRATGPF